MLKGHLILIASLLATAAVALAQDKPDDLVVSRGGVSVTLRDIDAFVSRVPKEHREHFIDSPQRIRDMLNNLLLTKQLAVQAREMHLDQRPDVVAQMKAAQDEVLSRVRLSDFLETVKVPDLKPLVAEQYATHKELYKVPASADVRHVLIATELHSDDEAKALAEKVRTEALAHPKDFEALVDKYSDDNSKVENHGLMKDATNPKYVEPFRNAAAALTKVGEISPLVQTSYGYHVLMLVAKNPEHQKTLDEVRDELTAQMRQQYVTNQRRDLVNQLTNDKLEINSATLDTLRDRYDENGNVKVAAKPEAKGGGGQPAPPPAAH